VVLDFSVMRGSWFFGARRRWQEITIPCVRIIRPHPLIGERYDRRWQNREQFVNIGIYTLNFADTEFPVSYRRITRYYAKQRDNFCIPCVKDDSRSANSRTLMYQLKQDKRIQSSGMGATEYLSRRKRPCEKRREIPFVPSCSERFCIELKRVFSSNNLHYIRLWLFFMILELRSVA